MTKRTSIVYLLLAPVLFSLSWYISHKLFERFMLNASGIENAKDRSLVYAGFFTILYIAAWFVIRDLYKNSSQNTDK
jgi:intracellular septation protein A